MNLKGLVGAAVGVVVGVIMLKIADSINSTTTYNATLTTMVMSYVPTLLAVGILIGSIAWGLKSLTK